MNINRTFFSLSENTPVQTGIDKIVLTIRDFELMNRDAFSNSLTIKGNQNLEDLPPVVTCRDGEQVRGRLFCNIEPAAFDIDYRGLRVTFNPSKMFHPYHLINTGTDLNNAIEHISNLSEEIGIKANIKEAQIARLDIASQSSMTRPPGMYSDAYKLCSGKRMGNRSEYPGGYRMGNRSVATICYDKAKELQDKGNSIQVTESNLLRVENRWQKSDALARHLHFNSLPILLKMPPQEIIDRNKHFLRDKVFKDKRRGEQLLIDFDSEVQVLQFLMAEYKRGIAPVIAHLGMANGNYSDTLSRFGGIEGYFELMLQAGISQPTAYRHKAALMELIRIEAKATSKREDITPGILLEELIYRFAA